MLRALFLSTLIAASAFDPVPDEPLEIQVNRSIELAAAKLLREQAADGSWGAGDKVHPLGRTALSLLALIHAGLPESHPDVARGITYWINGLRERRGTREGGAVAARSTYETGVSLMLLYALGRSPRYVDEMPALVDFLADSIDESQGLWGYPHGERDLSNTQYALLGLRVASLRDVKPSRAKAVWATALKGLLRCHKADGGFAYQPHRMPSSSMTVAGLTIVHLCEAELKGYGAAAKDLRAARAAADGAREWLARNFTVRANVDGKSQSQFNLYYYLYGLERYAVLTDQSEIAGRDWYREGAEFLIRKQADDGGFGVLEDTAFALLFLRKAALTMSSSQLELLGEARRDDNPRLDEGPAEPDPNAPCIREWLIAGSFPSAKENDDALAVDHIGEKRAKPREGKRAGKERWERYESPTDDVDLQAAGAGDVDAATYAFTWIESDEAQDVLLWLDSDDGIRVFVDGEMVFEDHHHDGKKNIKAPLSLPAGRIGVMLKIENIGYFSRFKARFSDRDGRALDPGVRTTVRGP